MRSVLVDIRERCVLRGAGGQRISATSPRHSVSMVRCLDGRSVTAAQRCGRSSTMDSRRLLPRRHQRLLHWTRAMRTIGWVESRAWPLGQWTVGD